jgi:phage-related protein
VHELFDPKPVIWVGQSRRELKALPRPVQRVLGLALWTLQCRRTVAGASPMRGTRLRGVLEVREDFLGRKFRMMVAAQLGASVWVLCAYEKKARRGIRTPASLIARVERRLAEARIIHAGGSE